MPVDAPRVVALGRDHREQERRRAVLVEDAAAQLVLANGLGVPAEEDGEAHDPLVGFLAHGVVPGKAAGVGEGLDGVDAECLLGPRVLQPPRIACRLQGARELDAVPGIGVLGSTALAATLGDGKAWRSGREFSASLGLVPAHAGTGGKVRVGHLSKRGDPYLRTLLIQGAKSAVMSAGKRDDPISRWLVQLRQRIGWQKACVAMANKNARILWAVMTRGQAPCGASIG